MFRRQQLSDKITNNSWVVLQNWTNHDSSRMIDKIYVIKHGLEVFMTETEIRSGSRYRISSADKGNKEQVNRVKRISSVQEYENFL